MRKLTHFTAILAALLQNTAAYATNNVITCSRQNGFFTFTADNSGTLKFTVLKICDLARGDCTFDQVFAKQTYRIPKPDDYDVVGFDVYKATSKPKDPANTNQWQPLDQFEFSPAEMIVQINFRKSLTLATINMVPNNEIYDSICALAPTK